MNPLRTFTEGQSAAAFFRLVLEEMPNNVTTGDPREVLAAFTHLSALTDTATQKGYSVSLTVQNPYCSAFDKVLMLPLVMSPSDYLCALHEFGHVFGPRQEAHMALGKLVDQGKFPIYYLPSSHEGILVANATIEAELGAWEWAITNAKVKQGSLQAAMALCSYGETALETKNDALKDEFFLMIRKLTEL